jgi:protein gp37
MAKIMDCIDWWGDEAKRSGNVTMAKLCEVTRNRMNVLHPIILPNVWMGVSVENQEAADERISYLLQVPAKVRFLSCEPLLGPIDLHKAAYKNADGSRTGAVTIWKGCGVNWVIAGGESGPGARPSNPDWYRRLRDDCKAANVPFFFKQWGEYAPADVTDSTTIGNVHPKHVYSFCYGGSHPFNCGDADGGLVY